MRVYGHPPDSSGVLILLTHPFQVQSISQNDKDILKSTIGNVLSERCDCPFSANNITDGRFSCNNVPNANSVLFQGSVIGSENVDSVEMLFYMQEWLLTEPTVTLHEFSLQAAENCHIYSKEPGNATYGSCEWLPNTVRECHKIMTIISISIGSLALLIMLAFAIAIVVCIRQRQKVQKKPM